MLIRRRHAALVLLFAAGCAPGRSGDAGPCVQPICDAVPPGCTAVPPADGCGCGVLVCGDGGLDDDAGFPPDDAGTPPDDDDAGFPPDDDDAGFPPDDDDAGFPPDDDDAGSPPDDAGATPDDAGFPPDDAGSAPDDAGAPGDGGAPWSGTIVVDGTNDFDVSTERFSTTTTGFFAYVTWDDDALYVGYEGADVTSGAASKWVQVYVDVDPGASTGAALGPTYNTQAVDFPTGFGAELHVQHDTPGTGERLFVSTYDGTWATTTTTGVAAVLGGILEIEIPWMALGGADEVGVLVLMMNEANLAESTYGGIYPGNFTDGYFGPTPTTNVPTTAYLRVDRDDPAPPNDPARKAP